MQSVRDKHQRLSAISRTTPIPSAPFALPFRSGEIIGGKYKVLDLIGTGGVAFVVSARHVALDEVVALKFLRPEFATHAEAVRRFTIEGRANFKIQSEHVVRVLDVDALPDGTPFIVMELLEGTDLGRVLETSGALPIELAVSYMLQACEGLATAHAAYVVHRDIKPENLFLTKNEHGAPRIKLLDFGISKVALSGVEQSAPAHTESTSILGSPPYMSPEQVRGSSETDARTDIWSLGCVLYELMTNRAPFERPSVAETCAAILTDQPTPLRAFCRDAQPALEAIVMRCLSKDPDARFQDVGQLAHALQPFATPRAHVSSSVDAPPAAEVAVEPDRESAPIESAIDLDFPNGDLNVLREFRSTTRASRIQQAMIVAGIAIALAGTYAITRLSMADEREAVPNAAATAPAAAPAAAPSVGTAPALRGGDSVGTAPALRGGASVAPHIATPAPVVATAVEEPAPPPPAAAALPDNPAPLVAPRARIRTRAPRIVAKPKSDEPDVGF